VATVLACVGLKAVFDSHTYADPPVPHLYSLHSWMGLAAVALAVAQWLLGKPDTTSYTQSTCIKIIKEVKTTFRLIETHQGSKYMLIHVECMKSLFCLLLLFSLFPEPVFEV
jgi:hypothetical protein